MKWYYNFWLNLVIINRVEIALLFISLERLRLEREQIFLDMEKLTSDVSSTKKSCF